MFVNIDSIRKFSVSRQMIEFYRHFHTVITPKPLLTIISILPTALRKITGYARITKPYTIQVWSGKHVLTKQHIFYGHYQLHNRN